MTAFESSAWKAHMGGADSYYPDRDQLTAILDEYSAQLAAMLRADKRLNGFHIEHEPFKSGKGLQNAIYDAIEEQLTRDFMNEVNS